MYAVFSIFIRNAFDSADGQSITETSNIMENIYLVLLFMILMASMGINVNQSRTYYGAAIIFLGIFLMIVLFATVYYIYD